MEEETMETKSNSEWSYLVNVAVETVFIDFVGRFESLLSDARTHVCDGYYHNELYSDMFHNGTKVQIFF